MGVKAELKKDGVNQILKSSVIFEEGDMIDAVALVIKGRIRMQGQGVNLVTGSGSFLGIGDINRGVHGMTYTALTNSVIYVFSVQGSFQDIQRILHANKDYGALMVYNLSHRAAEEAEICSALQAAVEESYTFIENMYATCLKTAQEKGVNLGEVRSLDTLQPFDEVVTLPLDKIAYYKECSKVSSEVQKAFFGASSGIASYHIKELIGLLHRIQEVCRAYGQYLYEMMKPLILNNQSLYITIARLATILQKMGENTSDVLEKMDEIIDHINSYEQILSDKAGIQIDIDREFMEETYFSLLSPAGTDSVSAVEAADAELALTEDTYIDTSQLEHAMEYILQYGEIDEETAQRFTFHIETFQHMGDKESTEDNVRKLRRSILKDYYPIYQKVFLKDYHASEETPLVIDLFLRYGFLSEELLRDDLIEDLLLLDPVSGGYGGCHVYDMKEWLTAILRGERQPSKNEFDMDYEEYLRSQKRDKTITPQQYEEYLKDNDRKLAFEIENMFRNNHRLVSEQMSTFVPFLYTESCSSSLERSFLSKDKINAAVNRIIQIDYSAFYREVMFSDEEAGIKKEFIQQEVYPDVLVFPAVGSRGIMWQELSGRRRNSPGRFLLPIFMEGDLDKTLTRLVGSFRWELCRTMQGAYWNNIQVKSLTSEYSDFLQFYRKNRDLSDEKKDKLKLQIQKHRNNSREIFASDYENWIRMESRGGVVLSKPVREIMATYCPFAMDIRKNIQEQPIFRDAMARFERGRAKKNREYELKFRVWEKDHVTVPKEIVATRDFYKEY